MGWHAEGPINRPGDIAGALARAISEVKRAGRLSSTRSRSSPAEKRRFEPHQPRWGIQPTRRKAGSRA